MLMIQVTENLLEAERLQLAQKQEEERKRQEEV